MKVERASRREKNCRERSRRKMVSRVVYPVIKALAYSAAETQPGRSEPRRKNPAPIIVIINSARMKSTLLVLFPGATSRRCVSGTILRDTRRAVTNRRRGMMKRVGCGGKEARTRETADRPRAEQRARTRGIRNAVPHCSVPANPPIFGHKGRNTRRCSSL